MKSVTFLGRSEKDLEKFPEEAKETAQFQIALLQDGEEPTDFRSMSSIAVGVKEIRIWSADGTYRVIYTASFGDSIYILHCFKKKTRKTSKKDIKLAIKRFKSIP
ncbi:type II toxin-antitoxin system RelE/ParE family toxin [Zymomonas mobilis]|uniref:Phage-related protein n=1 Tax=Zymomonas mobilis subsp. mobilis (strain ATCC 31821 / ZM4 / CP4) TaxID=264203 RepID=A0A806D7R1_ZYMMO|nr:type II toxin-antitoxin system RelE/ParE family toxin [Zymomonas mobilis]ADC33824.1 protein of unknown function DUF891 [Zymomonas mobilis subsp. mobilis ZM4 = ATCC 31821]AHB11045.1 phage-related protein [Zymomonas mobilis subsp. mobilis str. CP4 = NRRL B-14023]AHJ71411.1 Phage-related protein [Zymomonas mobilis subsp. mobilis NRRL B-12526]AHJ73302.1 Phage-related protein [Zymomonas mobilis subsp. mobilis str. CP4 = NRRL B-14023]